MPRRVAADEIAVHVYGDNRDVPGTCLHCHLIRRNGVHVPPDDPRLLELAAAQDEHRRRTGDR